MLAPALAKGFCAHIASSVKHSNPRLPQVKLVSVHFFEIWTSKKAQHTQFLILLTSKCVCATMACTFSPFELRQKMVRTRQFFTLLTWKCASRHNGVHFFDISTSKSGLRMVCFVHFDLEMCFSPQRRALFPKVFATFSRCFFRIVNSVSMGKTANICKPCSFCCALFAVCMGEAAKPHGCVSFVVYGSPGTCLCKLCSLRKYCNVFVQAL